MSSSTTRKKIVYVIGHTLPDTDCVCSAIGYAHFKNLTDKRYQYTPARAGSINDETRFVMEKFGVPTPIEIESLSPTVSDLELHKPILTRECDSVYSLAQLMREEKVRAVPVVESRGRVSGIVGLSDIAQFQDRKSTRLNSSHIPLSRMPSSA